MEEAKSRTNSVKNLFLCLHINPSIRSENLSEITWRFQHSHKTDVWLLVASTHKSHDVFMFVEFGEKRCFFAESELGVFVHVLVDDSLDTNVHSSPGSSKASTKTSKSDLLAYRDVLEVEDETRSVDRQKTADFDTAAFIFLENSL
ncbi:hypothetical protein [Brazilian marseillevirus]|uniref:hypothetical protein n=1 Tax=Brazilian marseillevirus TaxID=1813599 RepID=UPI000786773B|nr:hypothetical protein A3303_gp123 [Brazilian marseillevirus]AMQ10631.1 hypothetical protein [Brazilian marseillevirus]